MRPSYGNKTAQLICAWSGPVFAALFALGALVIGHYIPPMLAPNEPAATFVAKIVEHRVSVGIGAFFMMMAVCLMAPFGASIAIQTRKHEGDFPVLSYAQLGCVGAGTSVAMLTSLYWAMIAYRPTEYAASLVQLSADLAYFMVLFTWPIFSLWCIAIALAIFLDDNPVFPRWIAYLNIWAALLYVPGGAILFFKTGPFAWDGALGLYIPFVAFFGWVVIMSWATIRSIKSERYVS